MAEAARADGPTAAWRPVSAWHGIVAAGRDGRPDGAAGLTIERIDPASLVLVAALDGKATAVRDRMTERLGLSPPKPHASSRRTVST